MRGVKREFIIGRENKGERGKEKRKQDPKQMLGVPPQQLTWVVQVEQHRSIDAGKRIAIHHCHSLGVILPLLGGDDVVSVDRSPGIRSVVACDAQRCLACVCWSAPELCTSAYTRRAINPGGTVCVRIFMNKNAWEIV